MHFTVYITIKLHRSFNCNFTSIYNSVVLDRYSEYRYYTLWDLVQFLLKLSAVNLLKKRLVGTSNHILEYLSYAVWRILRQRLPARNYYQAPISAISRPSKLFSVENRKHFHLIFLFGLLFEKVTKVALQRKVALLTICSGYLAQFTECGGATGAATKIAEALQH